jgi:hypothetical protein
MLNSTEMVLKMVDVPVDSVVFVSYVAGRPSSPQAALESARSRAEGINPRHFTGRFKGISFTKKANEPVMTLWVEERDSQGGSVRGAYRAFNPALGTLLALEVLEKNAAV